MGDLITNLDGAVVNMSAPTFDPTLRFGDVAITAHQVGGIVICNTWGYTIDADMENAESRVWQKLVPERRYSGVRKAAMYMVIWEAHRTIEAHHADEQKRCVIVALIAIAADAERRRQLAPV